MRTACLSLILCIFASCAPTVDAPTVGGDGGAASADAAVSADSGLPPVSVDAGSEAVDAGEPVAEDAGPQAQECLSDINCPRGQYCLDSRCVDQCLDDSGCPEGNICDANGRCIDCLLYTSPSPRDS